MSALSDFAARAIIAACRELETDPIAVAAGAQDDPMSQTYPFSRSRAYAAIALRTLLPHLSRPAIARMVGASSPDAYLSTLTRRIELRQCGWWDAQVAARVLEAAKAEISTS